MTKQQINAQIIYGSKLVLGTEFIQTFLGICNFTKKNFHVRIFSFIDILGTSFTILFSSCIQTALCEYKIHQSNQNGTFGMKNSGKKKK